MPPDRWFWTLYWFEGSGHNGDFVFTVGGFHSRYKASAHHPNPPRVGISWQFDPAISITGKSYFAITPKVVMAGGRLRLVYGVPPLFAHLEVWADFLINYVPFYMMIEAGVSVRITFELDFRLVTIHTDVSIGATIHLEGPEFGDKSFPCIFPRRTFQHESSACFWTLTV